MYRIFLLTLFLLAFAVGCRKTDVERPNVNVETLPVLKPTAGGEMVLLPAGTFTMGDSARP